jgi:hypothetical protein
MNPIIRLKSKSIIIPLLFLFLSQSCTQNYYLSTPANVPMLKEKGDGKVQVAVAGNFEIAGLSLQTAYAVSNYIGLMLNYANGRNDRGTSDGVGFGENLNFGEFGIGYFKKGTDNTQFEIYGGAGFCRQKHRYSNDTRSTLNYARYFVQPAFGVGNEKIDFTMSLRFSGVQYTRLNFSNTVPERDLAILDYINTNRFIFYVEPNLGLRFGGRYVKALIQLGFYRSLGYGSSSVINNINLTKNFNATLGVSVDFKAFKGL